MSINQILHLTTLNPFLLNNRADNVLSSWKIIYDISLSIYNSLPSAYKPSFYQLVHHPVSASYNLARIYISAGKSNLYASQARLSTNNFADEVRVLNSYIVFLVLTNIFLSGPNPLRIGLRFRGAISYYARWKVEPVSG